MRNNYLKLNNHDHDERKGNQIVVHSSAPTYKEVRSGYRKTLLTSSTPPAISISSRPSAKPSRCIDAD